MTDPIDPDATRPPLEGEVPGLIPEPEAALEGLQGQILNQTYRIDRLIGRGGMGVVYKGVSIHAKHAVAIKVIKPELAADPEFLNMFIREAEKLFQLNHNALVRYFAMGFDPALDLHFLAFEYIDGPSVMKILDGKPVRTASLVIVLKRLAEGLQAAHAKGIVHLDLSPDNVLLPDAWIEEAKIIDFGIARKLDDNSDSNLATVFAGKYGYQAPELFGRYGRRIGEWSDVYSLALTVLAMAKGRPLDMGKDKFGAIEARREVPDLSFLDESLRPLFTSMLQPDPNARLQSMQQVLDGIARIGNEPKKGGDVIKADKKRSWRVPAIIAAGVAAIALGGVIGRSMSGQSLPVIAAAATGDIAATAAAVPCSSIRAQMDKGIYRLEGWKAESSPWPDTLTGENVDRRGVRSIADADAATCAFLARVLEATKLTTPDVAMPGYRDLKPSDGDPANNGSVMFTLNAELPPVRGPVLHLSYGPRGPVSERLAAFLKPREAAKKAYFSPVADMMLIVQVVTNDPAAEDPKGEIKQSEAEVFEWINTHCPPGSCHVAAGWLEIRE